MDLESQSCAGWAWLALIFMLHHVQGAAVIPQGSLCAVTLCLQDSIFWLLLSLKQVEKATATNGAFKLGINKRNKAL